MPSSSTHKECCALLLLHCHILCHSWETAGTVGINIQLPVLALCPVSKPCCHVMVGEVVRYAASGLPVSLLILAEGSLQLLLMALRN